MKSASTLLMLYLLLALLGAFVISAREGLSFETCLFETASAIGTVGLSLGITPALGLLSRGVLVGLMFFGRAGALTLLFAAVNSIEPQVAQYPLGRINVGSLLVREFHKLGHQVMAVDKNEARINSVLPFVTDAQIGDSTNAAFLRSLGVASFDVCIVTIGGDFQSSLETTSLLKELGGKLVVARADREVQAKFLLRNGADEVISPEKQVAEWAAIRYASDHVLDYVKLDEEHAIFEVAVPAEWAGRSVGQIDIRKRYEINILGVKRHGRMDLSVTPELVLTGDMTLLVLGEKKAIRKCFRI